MYLTRKARNDRYAPDSSAAASQIEREERLTDEVFAAGVSAEAEPVVAPERPDVAGPLVSAFIRSKKFALDPFQRASAISIEAGNSVLVAAPTGAGKTVVAEFAIFAAMQDLRDKVFYTAPMKALSNQKYAELVAEYGADQVGLLTGDANINSTARIVVMTTEVLRNMLYAGSSLLNDLAFVVMDEVHYLADRFRGAVWEEVIIHLPRTVRLIALSATVSNAEEFGDWLQAVRGNTEVIVSEARPVPLDQHVLVRGKLVDMFETEFRGDTRTVNPEFIRMAHGSFSGGSRGRGRRDRDRDRHQRRSLPGNGQLDRAGLVELLGENELLPAIFFVFSRNGCDQAVRQVLRTGVRLTTGDERREIRAIVNDRTRTLRDEDLAVLDFWRWRDGLERGVAAHHAGLLPAFKEVVEELFRRKLVKVVFATETLALGINMPARTVVLEKLEKFNGEARVPITPGEYTQLTGRAGRRGIDVEGHAVIHWRDELNAEAVASLASKRTYPLRSSFRPTYNMAVNLIDQFGRARTRTILESSFAQFQADRAVIGLARQVQDQRASLAGYAESMACHLGDFAEYSRIRRELTDIERKSNEHGSKALQRRRQERLSELRTQMRDHPCHRCPDREQHARWAERWWKLKRSTDSLTRQISERTGAVARVFDRVTDVLKDREYLVKDENGALALSESGRILKRIYGERDLLVAEALRRGLWRELDAPQLAAMACALVYEPRRDEGNLDERDLPGGAFRDALRETEELWSKLDDTERAHQLPGSEPLSTGLSRAMFEWVRGRDLDQVLREADMAAGDFVRWSKQTIDLLDQLANVGDPEVRTVARRALNGVRRGIVAYSSV
ncbi:DEAD/DEAH box helicase [Mycetocola tolaasinivorans]|uniref:DEAD/DEAH box helicase n=2 Tax=Mycetocola tolaasinivorans TaxID=76635 RepID=A0A3L7A213_9MICO|nr:DEAD/DEAH box helicase [Mycetocola tolaasinivorans]